MKRIEEKYPPGTRVRLEADYPGDPLHEVSGYMYICGDAYLVFVDGYMALTERVVG